MRKKQLGDNLSVYYYTFNRDGSGRVHLHLSMTFDPIPIPSRRSEVTKVTPPLKIEQSFSCKHEMFVHVTDY